MRRLATGSCTGFLVKEEKNDQQIVSSHVNKTNKRTSWTNAHVFTLDSKCWSRAILSMSPSALFPPADWRVEASAASVLC